MIYFSDREIELHWQEVPRTPGVGQVEETTFVGRIEFVQTFHRSRWCWAMDQRKREDVGHHGSRQVSTHFRFIKLLQLLIIHILNIVFPHIVSALELMRVLIGHVICLQTVQLIKRPFALICLSETVKINHHSKTIFMIYTT